MIDHAAACALLQAIIAAWMRDALGDERELWLLARFLETSPAHALRLAERATRNEPTRTRRRPQPGRPRGRPPAL